MLPPPRKLPSLAAAGCATVVAVMGGIETRRRIPLSITFDHRCLTGGEACRWLAAVIKDLEKPY